jgi:hypothetical protein
VTIPLFAVTSMAWPSTESERSNWFSTARRIVSSDGSACVAGGGAAVCADNGGVVAVSVRRSKAMQMLGGVVFMASDAID